MWTKKGVPEHRLLDTTMLMEDELAFYINAEKHAWENGGEPPEKWIPKSASGR